jgi:hypothetical protein
MGVRTCLLMPASQLWSHGEMMRTLVKVAGFVVLAGLVWVPSAVAGEYHVYACRQPSGAVAPADGWSGSAGPTYDDYTKDTCGEGGALEAALGDVTTHEADLDLATWMFSTPAYASMVGATLWRAGDAAGGAAFNATYELWLAGPSNGNIFESCVYQSGCTAGLGNSAQPLSAANRVVVPNADLGAHLYLNAACEGDSEFECPAGHGDANGDAAVVDLYAADIVLEQDAGPSVSGVAGELASATSVSGVSSVIFSATDPGAGVWETQFSVDGKLVQSTVADEDGGRCRDVGQSSDGVSAFLYLQPCPASESVDVPFSVAGLSDGAHHVVVSVLDAAGNSAPVLDRKIDVANPLPVSAASVVAADPPREGGRARLTLRVRPRRVSIGRSIRFSGQLEDGSVPAGGKVLVVEARARRRGRWLKFDLVRAGASGRFRGSYRFTFLGPGDWRLRVLCEGEAGYPFATGWSNVVRVRVVGR